MDPTKQDFPERVRASRMWPEPQFVVRRDQESVDYVLNASHVRWIVIACGRVVITLHLSPPEIDIARLLAVGEGTGAMKVLGPPPFPATVNG